MEKSVCEHQNKPAEQGLVENGPASITKDTADLAEVCAISSHSGKPLSCYGYSPPDSFLTGKLPLWQRENGSKAVSHQGCHYSGTTLCHYQHIRTMGYREEPLHSSCWLLRDIKDVLQNSSVIANRELRNYWDHRKGSTTCPLGCT